ncbi:hypothetical protein A3B19_03185 [Candidatus Giovannonibacteria bacterium RIFCSPLOWO2_01_FULL_46_32]|uniref:Peptidase A24A N-terminal domain-containing protein n=1 Tax=Candidatus Giovannonibacteria bacterium RIFCSPLOWO2_01_FULL_46_32 TaxID=1798353 RepID=A0A1F5XH06_9BACT|nr:MAG: hypothetical protein A3B19_03185 [Candidatus Giovannonibacteria bacterium RIFCSPLOWO2_01_FULL_46_32]
MEELFVFIFGLILGSFFNVVLLRKNTGEPIVKNGSRCFSCGKKLAWWQNVPILSFVFLRGRCFYCGSKISWQYPIIEVSSGIMGSLIYSKFPISNFQSLISFLFYFAAFSLLFLLAAYDFKNKIIDSHFLYAFAAFSAVEFVSRGDFTKDIASSFLIALFFYLLWRASGGRWMGRGDADVAFWASLFLGWPLNLGMLFLSFWLGGLTGALLLLWRGRFNLKSEIPFAPFLAGAAFAAWLFPDFFRAFYDIMI